MRKRSQPSQQAHNDGAAIPVGIGKDDNGQDYGCGDENERYGTGGNKAAWQAACEASHFSEWFSRGVSGVISIGGSGVILLVPAGF